MTRGAQKRRKGGADHDLPANPDASVELPKELKVNPHGHEAHAAGITALKDKLSSAFEKHDVDGDFIHKDFKDGASALTVARRLELLDERVSVPEGKSASDHVRELFPELARREIAEAIPPIPTEAPEKWKDARQRGEELETFIRRIYGTWIGNGLIRPDLRRLDGDLYIDLHKPAHAAIRKALNIPTLKEFNDQTLRRLGEKKWDGTLSSDDFGHDFRDMRRVIMLLGTKGRRGSLLS